MEKVCYGTLNILRRFYASYPSPTNLSSLRKGLINAIRVLEKQGLGSTRECEDLHNELRQLPLASTTSHKKG